MCQAGSTLHEPPQAICRFDGTALCAHGCSARVTAGQRAHKCSSVGQGTTVPEVSRRRTHVCCTPMATRCTSAAPSTCCGVANGGPSAPPVAPISAPPATTRGPNTACGLPTQLCLPLLATFNPLAWLDLRMALQEQFLTRCHHSAPQCWPQCWAQAHATHSRRGRPYC